MNNDLLNGALVRLTAVDLDHDAELFARWALDTEYERMLDTGPVRPWSAQEMKTHWGQQQELDSHRSFMIRPLADGRAVGFVTLDDIAWNHGDAEVGIGIGDRADWSKGYGTDALRVVERYAFAELNLHRLTLGVIEYNTRGIRCYEKAGFVQEGCIRQTVHRDGRRWDIVMMGILRPDWEQQQAAV